MKKIALTLFALLLTSCVQLPDEIKPVGNFELDRYLGKWYEIARLDHSFERGMSKVTADYSLREDGGVRVINRGYSEETQEWNEAEGKAYFVENTDQGYLKVSFFGPFYGAYIILELDHQNYRYSLVSGPDKNYLWLLSRTDSIDKATKTQLLEKARNLGYNTEALIWVSH